MGRRHRRLALGICIAVLAVCLAGLQRLISKPDTHGLTIEGHQDEEQSKAARVLGAAFASEPFTRTAFGGSVREVEDAYEQAIALLVRAHVDTGQPVFIAKRDGEVVGVAVVSRPGISLVPLRLAWLFRSHLDVLIRLIGQVHWRGLLHLARTVRPPKELPSRCYRLEAIGVAPAEQGEGVGGALLDAIHEFVEHDPSASGIYLFTGEAWTRDLYEAFEYETVETTRSDGLVAYHMFRPTAQQDE